MKSETGNQHKWGYKTLTWSCIQCSYITCAIGLTAHDRINYSHARWSYLTSLNCNRPKLYLCALISEIITVIKEETIQKKDDSVICFRTAWFTDICTHFLNPPVITVITRPTRSTYIRFLRNFNIANYIARSFYSSQEISY